MDYKLTTEKVALLCAKYRLPFNYSGDVFEIDGNKNMTARDAYHYMVGFLEGRNHALREVVSETEK